MTVKELKEELEKYPEEFDVIIDTSRDYEDYSRVNSLKYVHFEEFRGGHIRDTGSSNAVLLK